MADELFLIDDEDAPPPPSTDYLVMLAARLRGLILVVRKMNPAVAHYCRLLSNTIESIAPFYKTPGLLPRGEIDKEDSGFPCTPDLLFLFNEWRAAERGLRSGITEADLLEKMRRTLYSGVFPAEEYAALARRHHLHRIQGAEIAEEFRITSPLLQKETETYRFYKLSWRGWDDKACLFRFSSLFFAQDKETRPIEEIRKDSPAYQKIREEFQRPLAESLDSLGFREGIHPKNVDRFTIGPYHTPDTSNSPDLRSLFDGFDHPFLLKMTLERLILQTGVARPNLIDELMGEAGPRPVSLLEQRSRYALCSPGLKSRLGTTDERGEAATLFTLEPNGDVT